MIKRRTNQILIQILEACHDGNITKTRIVYASGLNFKTVIPYLDSLLCNGLLIKSSNHYKITEKGIEALGHLRAYEAMMPGP